jgi:hypothetical protein
MSGFLYVPDYIVTLRGALVRVTGQGWQGADPPEQVQAFRIGVDGKESPFDLTPDEAWDAGGKLNLMYREAEREWENDSGLDGDDDE